MRLWSAKRSSVSRVELTASASTRRARAAVTWRAGSSRRTIRAARRAIWLEVDHLGRRRGPAARRGRDVGHRLRRRATATSPRRRRVPFERASFAAARPRRDRRRLHALGRRPRAAASRAAGAPSRYDLVDRLARGAARALPDAAGCTSGGFPAQKIVSPIPNARISGTIDVQGETWSVERVARDGRPQLGRRQLRAATRGATATRGTTATTWSSRASARACAPAALLLPPSTALCLRHHGTSYMLSGFASLAHEPRLDQPAPLALPRPGPRVVDRGRDVGRHRRLRRPLLPEPRRHRPATASTRSSPTPRSPSASRGARRGRCARSARRSRSATRDPHHGVRMYV